MPKQVTTPDGVTHEFPDEATEAQILEVLQPSWGARARGLVTDALRRSTPGLDVGIGALKGAAGTAANLGQLALEAPVVGPMLQGLNERLFGLTPEQQRTSFGQARGVLEPSNALQSLGRGAEQTAEFLLPASRLGVLRGAARVGAEGALGGAVTKAQGGDVTTGTVAGAGGALAVPGIGRAVSGLASALKAAAPRAVRAGAKMTVTEAKHQAGASVTGINAQANRLVRFIIDKRLTTPQKAEQLIADAETQIQRELTASQAPGLVPRGTPTPDSAITDAPVRGLRYLQALKRSAQKQGLPEHDVRIIIGKAREFLRGPHGESVTYVPQGQTVPVTRRFPRQDMTAREALESARATSKWTTRKQYGELKGAAVESAKAVERADRDAVKRAVPGTRPWFAQQRQGIAAKRVLDRQQFRESNRDVVGLPTWITGAAEVAHGNLPIFSAAAQWLRDNQLKAGIYADVLADAIRRQDLTAVTTTLARLGVPAASLATQP